ncbi:MAG: hypothetical protein ABGW72_00170 [bacterium]
MVLHLIFKRPKTDTLLLKMHSKEISSVEIFRKYTMTFWFVAIGFKNFTVGKDITSLESSNSEKFLTIFSIITAPGTIGLPGKCPRIDGWALYIIKSNEFIKELMFRNNYG